MPDLIAGFSFTELYSFTYDIVLLILVFSRGKNDTAAPIAKGKRI